MIYQYVCKFYLNASHYIYIQNNKGEPHSHCFELAVDIGTRDKTSFVSFTEIERSIETILQPYQEQLLNEVAPFDEINPTLENIAGYFEIVFIKELASKGWVLLTLEVSETPTRSYLINVAEDVGVNKKMEKLVQGNRKNITPVEQVALYNDWFKAEYEEKTEVGFDNDIAEDVAIKKEHVMAANLRGTVRRKVVDIQPIKAKQETVEMLDRKTGLHYAVVKKLNAKETEYDYEIPLELLHFDYDEPVRTNRFV